MQRRTGGRHGRMVARAAAAAACAVACSAAHALVQEHYVGYCRGSWLALFSVDPSPYCAFVRKSLGALQFAPLLAAAPLLGGVRRALTMALGGDLAAAGAGGGFGK